MRTEEHKQILLACEILQKLKRRTLGRESWGALLLGGHFAECIFLLTEFVLSDGHFQLFSLQ